MTHVLIIGNGISGVTAARHIRKNSDYKITIVSSESKHFFSRTALMYIYMGHMKYEHTKPYEDWFWKKNKIDLIQDKVEKVDFQSSNVELSGGEKIDYDFLVLACGSKPRIFDWPGLNLRRVQGLYSLQDLNKLESYSKEIDNAVIVGGGLIGVELAEMLLSRGKTVTFLVRESLFWNNVLPEQESRLISKHIQDHGVNLLFEEELEKIIDDGNGNCAGIITKSGKEIKCEFVGLTIGVTPNIDFLQDSELEINRGIIADRHFQTNIPNVYAVGDCVELSNPKEGRRAIEQVWYTGRMHGEVAAANICGNETEFNPGPWFNSAKFFDIEYQTYGVVMPQLSENEDEIVWQHHSKPLLMHLVFEKDSHKVIGVNFFGIRHRHELWDKWLKENKTLYEILPELYKANFDPEFFELFEDEIIKLYNVRFPDKAIKSKRKKTFLEKIGVK